MPDILLVDGYNIINASNRLKKLPIEQSRDELCSRLYDYAAFRGYDDLIIVFDAHMQKTPRHVEETECGLVVYTAPGETADNYIERAVRLLYAPKTNIKVATSDGVEQVMIMGYAQRMSARELLEDIRRVREEYRSDYINSRAFKPKNNTLEGRLSDDHKRIFEILRRGGKL